MYDIEKIKTLIPHRPPFLLVDRVVDWDGEQLSINTEKTFPADFDVFKGHYPDKPIVPGVLLSESIFQSAAILMALLKNDSDNEELVPVLTRIGAAKFKRFAKPDDLVSINVTVIEKISPAIIFKGKMKINGKLAVQIEFTCAMVEKEG